MASAAHPVRQPATTRTLPPTRRVNRPENMPTADMVTEDGSSISPDAMMLAPNPYPAARGVWTNSGRKANVAYMPVPSSSATRLDVHTAGIRIICMSISGVAARSSANIQPATSRALTASRPITAAEPQPQPGASLTATSSATSQADISTAGRQLIRPGMRTGEDGTNSTADTAATTVRISGSQNSQCQSSASTIGPARTIPSPAPTPVSAAMDPTAPLTRSAGNSSRMIPNASGTMPPPMPWITRAAIITAIEEATADSSEPAASAISDTTNTRCLPTMSPTRPRMGVMTDADSR